MQDMTRTLARMAATAGLPGADRRHLPELWTDLVAVWRDHGLAVGPSAPKPPSSRHPAAPPPPFAEAETQWRLP